MAGLVIPLIVTSILVGSLISDTKPPLTTTVFPDGRQDSPASKVIEVHPIVPIVNLVGIVILIEAPVG